MSLTLEETKVVGVLLSDGWHTCRAGEFYIDAYEFVDKGEDGTYPGDWHVLLGGGQNPLISATGFSFKDHQTGQRISGPMTSVMAVRTTK